MQWQRQGTLVPYARLEPDAVLTHTCPTIRCLLLLLLLYAQVSLVTLDLSFISVLKVMPALAAVMAPGAQMVVLIKPQFEAGRAQVGAGGLVKDPQVG